MKKYGSILLALCLLCLCAPGCAESKKDERDFIDLTRLTDILLFAELNNIMASPGNYVGKTIKVRGTYDAQFYEPTQTFYHAVLIADETSCCSQGFEFRWSGEHSYPEDYPEIGAKIEITGVFGRYDEFGNAYHYLKTDGITAL